MAFKLKLVDETTSGEVYNETILQLVSERISIRHLIEQRVREEVENFNAQKKAKIFSGLIQPRDTERILNGYEFKKHNPIDPDKQVAVALKSFGENGFFILIDDRQAETLDEEFSFTQDTKVTFLKLIPVVGG